MWVFSPLQIFHIFKSCSIWLSYALQRHMLHVIFMPMQFKVKKPNTFLRAAKKVAKKKGAKHAIHEI